MHYDMTNAGIHFEPTSNCNSRCLDCGRFVRGTDILNPHVQFGKDGKVDLKIIKNIFDPETASKARYIMFSGTYGDATNHPDFLTMVNLIGQLVEEQVEKRVKAGLDPKLMFMMETNGGLHDNKWWSQLALIIRRRFNKDSHVVFAIDGSDDETHQMYRRGVPMGNVLKNAKTVIKHNVRTVWSFIQFEHNKHQVKKARKIAEKNGFAKFKIRRSRLRTKTALPVNVPNITQKNKRISKESLNWSKEDAQIFDKHVKVEDMDRLYFDGKYSEEFINEPEIVCEWREKKQISIDYTGRVWQCCYFSNFYHTPIDERHLERAKTEDLNLKSQQYENLPYYENQYEKQWNNVKYHKLSDIMNHKFFVEDLPDSWNNKIDDENNPLIYRCGKFCGKTTRARDTKLKEINANK